MNEHLYTTHEAAELLHVKPITVIRWIKKGRLKCMTTLGGHRRIEQKDLDALIESLKSDQITDKERLDWLFTEGRCLTFYVGISQWGAGVDSGNISMNELYDTPREAIDAEIRKKQ